MYYITHRPKTLANLDNTAVKEKIKNLLLSPSLPHAYLFLGQKGTGKTSSARIVAKAVNCLNNSFAQKGTSIEPCNTCNNCFSIDTSSSPDVIELDAASNRGIEEIRRLIRESAFSPMVSRYRVFIIDEAHMITHDAFNALLKTLEEPPSTVLFILATTNQEKIPKTISSRCIIIPFGKAKKEDVFGMLQRIVKHEKLTVDESVLKLIASHSERSFRDATKILEELVIQNKLTVESAKEYLGLHVQQSLLEVIEKKPLKDTLQWVEEFLLHSGNMKNLIEDTLEELRQLLLAKNGIGESEITYTFSNAEIGKLMKLFTDAYNLLRISPIESIPLEIAIVEFYNSRKS